ncbi:MAG: c-type cytochrome [Pyrinomonadaceae bacterium]|nr:c-type cytochrome [Pyrinomonadaceae bacterium]
MHKSTRLLGAGLALILGSLALTLQSFGQGGQRESGQQNKSTNKTDNPPSATQPAPAAPQDFSKNTWDLPADADKTKNPVEATEESIAQGKELFMTRKGNCIFCHGETGTGNKENLARLRRVPADLSDHKRMPKLSDGEIFWKITKGIPGIMPSREKLTEEERWHLVNFVRSLAKEKPKA